MSFLKYRCSISKSVTQSQQYQSTTTHLLLWSDISHTPKAKRSCFSFRLHRLTWIHLNTLRYHIPYKQPPNHRRHIIQPYRYKNNERIEIDEYIHKCTDWTKTSSNKTTRDKNHSSSVCLKPPYLLCADISSSKNQH